MNSTEAIERSIIGGIFTDHRMIAQLATILRPQDFSDPIRADIWRAVLKAFSEGMHIEMASVLRHCEQPSSACALEMTECTEVVTSTANSKFYAMKLVENGIQSVLPDICEKILRLNNEDPAEAIRHGLEEFTSQVERMKPSQAHKPIEDPLEKTKALIERKNAVDEGKIIGIPTGIRPIDHHTGGIFPGDMVVIGARPGTGKTAVMLTMAYNMAKAGTRVGILSLEMTRADLGERLISIPSNVEYSKIRRGVYSNQDLEYLSIANREVSKLPIFVDDSPDCDSLTVMAKAKQMVEANGIGVLFVDYLQLMTGEGSEYDCVTRNSKVMKPLAKRLGIPVVVLSQMNRASEDTAQKKPESSQLRSSGQIEQDADGILLLWRPEMYNIEAFEDGDTTKDTLVILQTKWRSGGAGLEYRVNCKIGVNRIGYREDYSPMLFSPAEPRTDTPF